MQLQGPMEKLNPLGLATEIVIYMNKRSLHISETLIKQGCFQQMHTCALCCIHALLHTCAQRF